MRDCDCPVTAASNRFYEILIVELRRGFINLTSPQLHPNWRSLDYRYIYSFENTSIRIADFSLIVLLNFDRETSQN